LLDYALFLAKALTWIAGIGAVGLIVAGAIRSARPGGHERLEIKNVNQRLRRLAELLNAQMLGDRERKAHAAQLRRQDKARRAAERAGAEPRPRVFVLDFQGDLEASRVTALREEISALLQVARPTDEVLVRLESAGGMVHGYGLAASQLRRIRDRKLRLTIAVDKVAASGGYLMASVADRIVAAPFAIVGSIGVVAQLPNFNRLLREHHIDYELHTAGEFKRTLTLFGENTAEARTKFREELEQTHALFKAFVAENRPQLSLERTATGEHWYGAQAIALGLVDELRTSDDYLLDRAGPADVFELRYRMRRSFREQLLGGLAGLSPGLGRRWRTPAEML
jgi:serine protease SohB